MHVAPLRRSPSGVLCLNHVVTHRQVDNRHWLRFHAWYPSHACLVHWLRCHAFRDCGLLSTQTGRHRTKPPTMCTLERCPTFTHTRSRTARSCSGVTARLPTRARAVGRGRCVASASLGHAISASPSSTTPISPRRTNLACSPRRSSSSVPELRWGIDQVEHACMGGWVDGWAPRGIDRCKPMHLPAPLRSRSSSVASRCHSQGDSVCTGITDVAEAFQ